MWTWCFNLISDFTLNLELTWLFFPSCSQKTSKSFHFFISLCYHVELSVLTWLFTFPPSYFHPSVCLCLSRQPESPSRWRRKAVCRREGGVDEWLMEGSIHCECAAHEKMYQSEHANVLPRALNKLRNFCHFARNKSKIRNFRMFYIFEL